MRISMKTTLKIWDNSKVGYVELRFASGIPALISDSSVDRFALMKRITKEGLTSGGIAETVNGAKGRNNLGSKRSEVSDFLNEGSTT